MLNQRSTIIVCVLIGIAALQWSERALAGEFFQSSNTSVSTLTGWGYELTGDHLSAFTLENSNRWNGGDFYGFVDFRLQHDHPNNRNSWYGEFSPRFSLGKLAGLKFGDKLLKDVLIATSWERGEGGNESYLVGVGTSLNVSGFSFLKANLYARKDQSMGAGFDDMQLTFAWRYPFDIGKYRFVNNGIADIVFGWGPRARNFHIVPQILLDAGANVGKPGKYYLGLEIDYWAHQFGVRNSVHLDTQQVGVSLIFRAHL